MPKGASVHIYKEAVRLKVKEGTEESMKAIAFQILAMAQPNTPIDTGFLVNSGYVAAKGLDTYSQAKAAAEAQNPEGTMAPRADLGDADAFTCFGANYAIYVEAKVHMLFGAAEAVGAQIGAIVEPIFKRVIGK